MTLSLLSVHLLGQRLEKVQLIATLVSYAGVVLISMQNGAGPG